MSQCSDAWDFDDECAGKAVIWTGEVHHFESEDTLIVKVSEDAYNTQLFELSLDKPFDTTSMSSPIEGHQIRFSGILYSNDGRAHEIEHSVVRNTLGRSEESQRELAERACQHRYTDETFGAARSGAPTAFQKDDGSWRVSVGGALGSGATTMNASAWCVVRDGEVVSFEFENEDMADFKDTMSQFGKH